MKQPLLISLKGFSGMLFPVKALSVLLLLTGLFVTSEVHAEKSGKVRRFNASEINELRSSQDYQYDRLINVPDKDKKNKSRAEREKTLKENREAEEQARRKKQEEARGSEYAEDRPAERIDDDDDDDSSDSSKFSRWLASLFTGSAKFFIYALMILIVGVIIFFIVKLIMDNKKNDAHKKMANNRSDDQYEYEEIENIYEMNLEDYRNKAVAEGKFRWAIRYWYLIILRKMDENSMIRWELDKTNYDYISELKDHKLKAQLRQLTLIFEYAWYGELTINEQEYQILASEFDAFNKKLTPKTQRVKKTS